MKTFHAQLQDFANLTKKNIRYVATNAISDVVEAAQVPQVSAKRTYGPFQEGKIPVDTGALRKSLISGANGSFGPQSEDSYAVALAGYDLGDYMRFGWTAPYAMAVEAGTGRMAGRHFVGKNAARFSAFVEKYAREVRK